MPSNENTTNENEIVYFAKTNFRNKFVKFGIKKDDRRRHMYLMGKTGMGKTTVIENMVVQDIQAGRGVALVDPHGDIAEKILDFIPASRINDVIYFNPSDFEYPIAFNVMEAVAQEHKHLIASGMVGVFKKLWADSWGPRLEYVLRNAILALMDYPDSTLLGVMRILVDKNYRKKVIAQIQDPVVKSFWVEEYSKYPDRFQAEAIAPIQNKVGQFLSTALIRNVVGQVKSTINIRNIMDNKKILIMNLSKGRIGEDSSALLGAMMITKIQLAAMSRVDVPEKDRQDFYLYVDEFQNFATESFANILSEARKYRLNLIIAHQYIEQLDEKVSAAVFGNVGTIMCFRVGAADAEFLVKEFTPYFEEEDLVNLTKFDIYMKLMIDGVSSSPFSASTLVPLSQKDRQNNAEKIINASREKYSKPKDEVEEKIADWSSMMEDEAMVSENRGIKRESDDRRITMRKFQQRGPAPKEISDEQRPKSMQDAKSKSYIVECYDCGNPTEVHFKPDGIRPVYCKECFRKSRQNIARGNDSEEEMKEKNSAIAELSLSEAINQEPVFFYSKKQPDEKPDHPPQMTPEKRQSPQPQTDKDANTAQKTPGGPKILRPGEVAKF